MPQHLWVAATEVSVPRSAAAKVARRGKFILPASVEVGVVEVYCRRCRRTLTDEREAQSNCVLGPQHIGGPRKRDDDPEERVGA